MVCVEDAGSPEARIVTIALDDGARRELAVGQELEDPPAHRVAEHVHRVHGVEDISDG